MAKSNRSFLLDARTSRAVTTQFASLLVGLIPNFDSPTLISNPLQLLRLCFDFAYIFKNTTSGGGNTTFWQNFIIPGINHLQTIFKFRGLTRFVPELGMAMKWDVSSMDVVTNHQISVTVDLYL